mmetsp:Transcript_4519/g.13278  ORF Transcript_4519/g.13278 Transcript_4519/m.13278 type:complete len:220 (+) Transcript_4519:3-662(+)
MHDGFGPARHFRKAREALDHRLARRVHPRARQRIRGGVARPARQRRCRHEDRDGVAARRRGRGIAACGTVNIEVAGRPICRGPAEQAVPGPRAEVVRKDDVVVRERGERAVEREGERHDGRRRLGLFEVSRAVAWYERPLRQRQVRVDHDRVGGDARTVGQSDARRAAIVDVDARDVRAGPNLDAERCARALELAAHLVEAADGVFDSIAGVDVQFHGL